MRILAGVGAWLVGVGAATAGSLLAVSLLGQGIATGTSQQLTAADVNRALAAEASDSPEAVPATTSAPSPAPSATRSYQAQMSRTTRPQPGAAPSARASRSRPAASPSTQPTAAAGPASTVLTSPGGTVVADCRPVGAYLVSWSPVPGYESGTVIRGPAVTARVTFNSAANSVTMMVSCSAGVPTATTTVGGSGSGGGGDDGGGGGDE
jgi:eukaryotic-like serine/threonine-protein kinase